MVFKQASIYAISDFTSPSIFAQKWNPIPYSEMVSLSGLRIEMQQPEV